MPSLSIDEIFLYAVKHKASDIHLIANLPPIVRIDGVLQRVPDKPVLTPEQVKTLCFSILNESQRKIYESKRELDISYEIKDVSRFRVNMLWEKTYPGLVSRVISTNIPAMEELLMPPVVYDLLDLNQGLILVTGPTGCGKSTSLAAMIELLNSKRNANIITLEDPIEFLYTPKKSVIRQRQLGSDMLSFGEGLKHVLRQDPNIILVGEMRDLETIASTITLAETGHLVFATLHTLNAAQSIDRIIDVFPPYQQAQVRLQLSLFLRGIISQLLLPKNGGGRVAAREVLINTPAIANLIRENKVHQIKTAIQTSSEEGMMTMDQSLKQMYQNELISREVAVAHMANPEFLD
ncbi:MAG: type IV pilus twitching motility protein PilT [Candidatus Nomurabacteria bacterium]|nr:MAG: type IV pilus twitching motility protein PilT [Candidatus Nomurabacteria bacterium]